MRMRQSVAEIEEAFAEEISRDRERRDSLRRTAELRTRKRHAERANKHGSIRYLILVCTLILTAALVTIVMFRTLYVLLG
jgi:Flp pilus assembly protein TadB